MSFKDILEEDTEIFLNTDEFAEIHQINSIDTVILPEYEKFQSSYFNNLNSKRAVFRVKPAKFPYEVNEMVSLDGLYMTVKENRVSNGMARVVMEIDY